MPAPAPTAAQNPPLAARAAAAWGRCKQARAQGDDLAAVLAEDEMNAALEALQRQKRRRKSKAD